MPSEALEQFRPELAAFFTVLSAPPDAPPPPGSLASGLSPGASATNAPNPISLDGVRFPITQAVRNAPVEVPELSEMSEGRYPVVLFSPGYGLNREQGTALVEDLASHGYVVVTISHTYESAEVEFPDERLELGRHDLDNSPHVAVALRRDDARFVLDKLHELAAGVNPDVERRKLPEGLGRSLDLTRIGMFGHSLGGATTVQTMANDDRVIAGIDLDGTVFPDIDPLLSPREELNAAMALLASRISNRPFMFMSSGGAGPDRFFGPFLSSFWSNLYGWRRFVSLSHSGHYSYTDNELLFKQCISAGILPLPNRAGVIDRWLRGRDTALLDAPSTQFPEIIFY
jgi:dienelactone hydrolase